MNARTDRKVRALLLAGLLLVPGMQGCSADAMSILKQLHPYVGKILDSAGKGGAPAKAAKTAKTQAPLAATTNDGAKANKQKDAKTVEQL